MARAEDCLKIPFLRSMASLSFITRADQRTCELPALTAFFAVFRTFTVELGIDTEERFVRLRVNQCCGPYTRISAQRSSLRT